MSNDLSSIKKENFEPIRFEVIKEPWNTYRVEDGALIGLKWDLVNLFSIKKEDGQQGLTYAGKQNVTVFEVPGHLRKDPQNQDDIYDIKTVYKEDMDFDIESEAWNKYLVKNKDGSNLRFNVKVSAIGIARTDKFSKFGLPIYYINWSIGLIVKPDL